MCYYEGNASAFSRKTTKAGTFQKTKGPNLPSLDPSHPWTGNWVEVLRGREKERERKERTHLSSVAILAQVAVGNPRRLEPRWNLIRLNQLGRNAGGGRLVPTFDVGAVSSSIREMRQRRRRW